MKYLKSFNEGSTEGDLIESIFVYYIEELEEKTGICVPRLENLDSFGQSMEWFINDERYEHPQFSICFIPDSETFIKIYEFFENAMDQIESQVYPLTCLMNPENKMKDYKIMISNPHSMNGRIINGHKNNYWLCIWFLDPGARYPHLKKV